MRLINSPLLRKLAFSFMTRFLKMTNFNSDFVKLIPGKVSCNREIETSDKNAAVNRACADDGNVESRTAIGYSIRSWFVRCMCTFETGSELLAGGAPWLERNDACSRTISWWLATTLGERLTARREEILTCRRNTRVFAPTKR